MRVERIFIDERNVSTGEINFDKKNNFKKLTNVSLNLISIYSQIYLIKRDMESNEQVMC